MNMNLRRGLLEGVAVAGICTGLLALLFWRTETPFTSSKLSDMGLVALATGLLGFLVGAFRSTAVRLKK